MKKKVVFNWSGGKDSSLALYYLQQDTRYQIAKLLTSVGKTHERVSMHGVRKSLLKQQVDAMDFPLHELILPESPEMDVYNRMMKETLHEFQAQGITHSAFGDIFLEDLKQYREERLAEVGMEAVFPIWKRDTTELLKEFVQLGFKTVIVCAKAELLDESFAGRVIDEHFLEDLPQGVDPCGENGEFHTFVFDGPIFKHPISYELGETVFREYKAPKPAEGHTEAQETSEKKLGYYFKDLKPLD